MVYRVTVFRLPVLCCLLLLCSCGLQQARINSLANDLSYRGAQYTLTALEKITPAKRDRAQYFLNRGRLKSIIGDVDGSISDLTRAKKIMASLDAISVTENLGATTVNETLRSYTGTPSERVMVHLMLAYNYLSQNNLDGARVEILQADVTMAKLADEDSLSGQLASAHFTSGLVYELNNEWDDAMISYRRAAEIMDKHKQALPPGLEDSLLQISYRQGLDQEYEGYVERFSRKAKPFEKGDAELIIVYSDGNVSTMQAHTVRVFSRERNQLVSLSMPYYPPANYRPQSFTINVAGQYYRTRILENIETLAREDLRAQLPRITATALLRVVLKYQAVESASKEEEWAGILMGVAAVITESADVRSWNMLPSSLQIARIRIEQGLGVDVTTLSQGLTHENVLSFNGGKKLLLLANSIK